MLSSPRVPMEEICPVSDQLLANLYRANKFNLRELIAAVVPDVRASLAMFCYRRSHFHDLGLSIAASCDEDDLVRSCGGAGGVLFARSRETPVPDVIPYFGNRRKVTLATGPLRTFAPDDEPDDEAA
jgi:hypothetical protein